MPRWSTNGVEGAVVSYRLAKQRLVAAVRDGHSQAKDVCDAQPELRRVAHNHAAGIDEPCPICEGDDLVLVTFAFGAGLPTSGRCVSGRSEMKELKGRGKPATFYLVEVCRQCWWNHLRESFAISGKELAAT